MQNVSKDSTYCDFTPQNLWERFKARQVEIAGSALTGGLGEVFMGLMDADIAALNAGYGQSVPQGTARALRALLEGVAEVHDYGYSNGEVEQLRLIRKSAPGASVYLLSAPAVTVARNVVILQEDIYDATFAGGAWDLEDVQWKRATSEYIGALRTLSHELVHAAQFKRLGANPFRSSYLLDVALKSGGNDIDVHKSSVYEREAMTFAASLAQGVGGPFCEETEADQKEIIATYELGINWHPCEPTVTSYVKMGSELPLESIVLGKDDDGEPLYACRAPYPSSDAGSIQPGKTRSGWGGNCNIGWDGREVVAGGGKVLVSRWLPGSGGSIPKEAASFGWEADHTPLYTCRASIDGSIQPGKVRVGFDGCHIPYGLREISVSPYEVLAIPPDGVGYTWSCDSHIPPDAIRGGTDTDGQSLYLCFGLKDNSIIPGKARRDHEPNCYVAWNDGEHLVPTHAYLARTFDTTPHSPGAGEFFAGVDRNGTHLGLCTAALGSFVQVGRYRDKVCHVGYAGVEQNVAAEPLPTSVRIVVGP
jgi:hypothetical protein